MSQKVILAAALELAQKAVQRDSDDDVEQALVAYREACDMLSKVLLYENVKDDRRKLNQIYETYTDRIRLLEALHPLKYDNQGLRLSIQEASSSSGESHPAERHQSRAESNYSRRAAMLNLHIETDVPGPVPVSKDVSTFGDDAPCRQTVRERRATTMGPRDRMLPTHYLPPLTTLPPLPPIPGQGAERRSSRPPRKLSDSAISLQRRSRQSSRTMSLTASPRDNDIYPMSTPSSQHSVDSSLSMANQQLHNEMSPKKEPIRNEFSSVAPRSPSIRTTRTSTSIKSSRSKMPKDPLSRPYWMMRLLLNTFASSRTVGNGTFITDSLFFPRDLWNTKNVKLKGEEEKIHAFQLIVHELQQLGRVDKNDITSLFRSLEALEKVIAQAQTILAKKLSAEVVESASLPILEKVSAPTKKSSGLSLSKFLKVSSNGDREGESPASLSRDFEGEHVMLQRTTFQLFGLAQLLEQINLNLDTESLPVKDQLRLDQTYNRAADFFSRVVVKLYLADACQLLHHRLTNSMPAS